MIVCCRVRLVCGSELWGGGADDGSVGGGRYTGLTHLIYPTYTSYLSAAKASVVTLIKSSV